MIEINHIVYDYLFSDETISSKYFKNVEDAKKICRLRVDGKTYQEIGTIVNKSPSTVRDYCKRIIRQYNNCIDNERHTKIQMANMSNFQEFCKKVRLYDVDMERLVNAISDIPTDILYVHDVKEFKDALMKWFHKEVVPVNVNTSNVFIINPKTIISSKDMLDFIDNNFKYVAEYYYNDPMCINDSGYVAIAYGNDESELIEYCESLGFKKTKELILCTYYN